MKIQGKRDIEYWITKSYNNQVIRVYQIDPNDIDPFNDKNPFVIPIYVEWMGIAESITDILEERKKLKEEVTKLTADNTTYITRWINHIENRVQELERKKKKWYQF